MIGILLKSMAKSLTRKHPRMRCTQGLMSPSRLFGEKGRMNEA